MFLNSTHYKQISSFFKERDYNSLKNCDGHKKIIGQWPFWKDTYTHKLVYKFNVEKLTLFLFDENETTLDLLLYILYY